MSIDGREQLLNAYEMIGFKLIRLNPDNKPKDKGWQNGNVPSDVLRSYALGGGGVGIQCGPVSADLVVIDLDGPFTADLAPHFLPETLTVRKGGEPPTHYYFFSEGAGYRQFRKLDGGEQIALKTSNNGKGHFVVAPPTPHPKKGPYEFVEGFDPNRIARLDCEDLGRRAELLSVCALIAERLPKSREEGGGGRHHYALSLAGYLIRNGETAEDVLRVLRLAWEARDGETRKLEGIVRDTADKIARDDPATGGKTLEEIVPGLPKRLAKTLGWSDPSMRESANITDPYRVPAGYVVSSGGVYERREEEDGAEKRVPVASAPFYIVERLIDVATDDESLKLRYLRGGRWRETVARRSVIANTREITSLADRGFPVNSNNARGIVKYLEAFEAENIDDFPVRRLSSQMGWIGQDSFLLGSALIGDGEVEFCGPEGFEDSDKAYHAAGTFEDWREAVEVLRDYPNVLAAMIASFASPLLAILGAANFTVSLSGKTSSGKSTALEVAASVWGSPSSVMGDFNSTKVFIERSASVEDNLPVIFDETKLARRPADVAQLIYEHSQGRSRGRGTIGGVQTQLRWSSILIASGEQPMTSFTKDGGTVGRVLELWGLPFVDQEEETAKKVVALKTAVSLNYGHAGRRFVEWIIANADRSDEWRQRFAETRLDFMERAGADPVRARLAEPVAVLAVAAQLLGPEGAGVLPEGFDPSEGVWRVIGGEVAETDRPRKALEAAIAWATANQDRFEGSREDAFPPSAGYAGRWKDDEYLAFVPAVLGDILDREGFDPESIVRQWRDEGWIDHEVERMTKATKLMGKSARMIRITSHAVEIAAGDASADEYGGIEV